MKVTIDNIDNLPILEHDKLLLKALLCDLKRINKVSDKKLYLDWQDYHDEYSPERVDPCPDYYGMYRIYSEDTKDYIGIEMTIDVLDIVMYTLYNYIVDL